MGTRRLVWELSPVVVVVPALVLVRLVWVQGPAASGPPASVLGRIVWEPVPVAWVLPVWVQVPVVFGQVQLVEGSRQLAQPVVEEQDLLAWVQDR